jgi:3-hydroxybutyryl-CoA dehydratase
MRIDEIHVGDVAELAKTVTESDIALFAGVTGDFNAVHIDAEAAKKSVFGERIAHGMLSAGFISAVLGMRLPGSGSIYLSQTLRFTKPVRIGDTVTARVEVVEVIAAKRRVRLATTCRNQNDEVVVEGEAVVMMENRDAGIGNRK